MSVLTDLLAAIIDELDPDDRPGLLALLGSIDDGVTSSSVDQTIVDHETVVDTSSPAFSVIRPSLKSIFVAWTGVSAVSGHGYYELQISTTASTSGLLDTRQTASTWTIFDALAANPSTTYYFRIRAVDAAGHVGDWSSWTNQATNPQLVSGEQLQSSNFVTGVSGWRILGNGDAEFNNVTVRGTIIATDGDIEGDLTVSGSLTVSGEIIAIGSGATMEVIPGDPLYSNPGLAWRNTGMGFDYLSTGDLGQITVTSSFALGSMRIDGPEYGGTRSSIVLNNFTGTREITMEGLVRVEGNLRAYQLYDDGVRVAQTGAYFTDSDGPGSTGAIDSGAAGGAHTHSVPNHTHRIVL